MAKILSLLNEDQHDNAGVFLKIWENEVYPFKIEYKNIIAILESSMELVQNIALLKISLQVCTNTLSPLQKYSIIKNIRLQAIK